MWRFGQASYTLRSHLAFTPSSPRVCTGALLGPGEGSEGMSSPRPGFAVGACCPVALAADSSLAGPRVSTTVEVFVMPLRWRLPTTRERAKAGSPCRRT